MSSGRHAAPRFVFPPALRKIRPHVGGPALPAVAAVLSVGAVSVATLAGLDGSGPTGSAEAGPTASGAPAESRATTLVSRSGNRTSGPAAAPSLDALPSEAAVPAAPAERSSVLESVPLPDVEEAVPTTAPSLTTSTTSEPDSGTSESSDEPSSSTDSGGDSTGGSGDGSGDGSGGSDSGPTSTLTEAQATARCLASGVSALDEAALADCVADLLG